MFVCREVLFVVNRVQIQLHCRDVFVCREEVLFVVNRVQIQLHCRNVFAEKGFMCDVDKCCFSVGGEGFTCGMEGSD